MIGYILYFLIFLLTLILVIVVKDKIKVLKLIGLLMVIASFLLLVLIFVVKLVVSYNINFINITSVSNYIFMEFVNVSLILFVIGLIMILISKYIAGRKVRI